MEQSLNGFALIDVLFTDFISVLGADTAVPDIVRDDSYCRP